MDKKNNTDRIDNSNVFGLIFIRLAMLHLTPPKWITSKTEGMRLLIEKPNPSRGQIVDRNGELFALDALVTLCLQILNI